MPQRVEAAKLADKDVINIKRLATPTRLRCQTKGASLNLCSERVNLRAEVKWPQATSSPEGQACLGRPGHAPPENFEI